MDVLLTILRIVLIIVAVIVIFGFFKKKSEPTVRRPTWSPPPPPPPRSARSSEPAPSRQRPQPRALELDVDRFTPLTDAQIQEAAPATGTAWGNLWFGRRDLIPPADDPRTNLIDRGMVAHGLITPEELTEIHRVGKEMDAVRPDLAMASHIAQRAVADDKEARRQLREQKKQEAAERKRKRAEEVAHRKATDIVYLGRGVSKGLVDRRANVEKLNARGLPVLATPADLASALGLPVPRLRWLAYHSDAVTTSHYIYFTIPKKGGGVRQLAAPHEQLAAAQQWVFTNILEKVPTHDAAHGFVKTRSTVTNAAPHVGKTVVLNCDLKDFFPSITFWRVEGVFRELGYSPAVSTILALLCTESPRREIEYAGSRLYVATGPRALPQGACTSPALSNLVARRFDSRLKGIAARLGWTYTRYADDLSFSGEGETLKQVGYMLARVRHIAEDEGFERNHRKTRVLRRNAAQSVTGIIVNDKPSVGRDVVRRIRAILHRAKTEGLEAQNRQKLPHFKSWLRGMIAYIHMVNPQQGGKLLSAYRAVAGN
jgi:retron-type reverse transcriptase